MADIFVYDANTEDFDTLGLCGPLSPTKCVHIEEANGMSELTIEHPIDQEGRWAYLIEGRIIKADVPVRTVPPITDAGDLVTSIEVWSIKSGMRPHLYYKAKGGKIRKKKLPSELEVRIVLKAESRYKAAFTARKKVKKKWKTYVYYGWIPSNALEYVTVESIPADPEAIEQVAPAWKVTDQLFRIHATKLTDKGVTVTARHIWYDLLGNVTTWTGLVGGVNAPECLDALHGILDNCTLPHEFEGYTNIVGTRDTIEWTRISPVDALCDPEAGLLARWGAELVRDNTEFYVLAEAGMNRGVRIEYAKNLLGVTCDVDMTDVVTRIQPVGQTAKGKPLLLAAGTYTVDGQSITIDATGTVVSPREGDYPTPHVMVLDIGTGAKAAGTSAAQVRAARVKMIRAALAKFAEDADLPRVSLKVDSIALGDTEEYAQYQRLDDVFLYDRVRVWHPKIGVDVLTKVNRIEFDCLLERFNGIELGAVRRDWTRTQVATWQVPAQLPGYKVASGSLGAGALADGTVTEDQLADAAITRAKIGEAAIGTAQIENAAITYAHIAQACVEALTSGSLEAVAAKIQSLDASDIRTDTLAAALAAFAVITAGTATFDAATVQHLVAEALNLEFGVGDDVFINNLKVAYAQVVSAAIGNLCIKASDGFYYTIDVGADGKVTASETNVSQSEIASGQTESGSVILETDITAASLNTGNLMATYALVNKIDAAQIDVGTLVARDALIAALIASPLGTGLNLSSNEYVTAKVSQTTYNNEKVYREATAPASPVEGMLWLNSSTNVLKRYTGTAWVDVVSENVEATSVSINNDTGLTVRQTLGGVLPTYFRADADQFGLYTTADDTPIAEAGVTNGKGYFAASMLKDVEVTSDYAVDIGSEEYVDPQDTLSTTDTFGLRFTRAGQSFGGLFASFAFNNAIANGIMYLHSKDLLAVNSASASYFSSGGQHHITGGEGVIISSGGDPAASEMEMGVYFDGKRITLAATRAQSNAADLANRNLHITSHVLPPADIQCRLGWTSYRWYSLYLTNSPNVSSDERYKADISSIDKADALLSAVEPVQFKRKIKERRIKAGAKMQMKDIEALSKKDGAAYKIALDENTEMVERIEPEEHFGFSAQQVKAAMASVGITSWAGLDESDPDNLGLCYEEFIAPLCAVVKAQKSRIAALEDALTALTNRVTALERRLNPIVKG